MKKALLNSAMKPAAPPLLRATRLLDLARERIRTNTIALRIGLGHAMESFIVERRLCGCAPTDCSGPKAHFLTSGHLFATQGAPTFCIFTQVVHLNQPPRKKGLQRGNASKLSKGPSGSLLFVQCRLDQLSFGHRGQAIANAAARGPERYP